MKTPTTPLGHHLLNAYLNWFTENRISPIHIRAYVNNNPSPALRERMSADGTIVLNVSPKAVRELLVDNKGVSFKARFNGVEQHLFLPLDTVFAVDIPLNDEVSVPIHLVNREALQYSAFGYQEDEPAKPNEASPTPTTGRPSLVVVK